MPLLIDRLRVALPLLERAAAALRGLDNEGYDEFDGKARSLVHDVEYIAARYADRIRVEAERLKAEKEQSR